MRESKFSIQKATTKQDFEDCVFVTNKLHKENLVNTEILIHDAANEENLLALARIGEQVAGTVVCKPSSSPNQAYTMIRILEHYRKKGLGSLLYKVASEHAKSIGRSSLQGRIVETDVDSIMYFEKRGFKEVARECKVSLYTDKLMDQEFKKLEGVEIFNLEQRKDLWEGAYKVACEGIPDIPMPEQLKVPSLENWVQSEIAAPEVRLDGSFVAVANERVIGYGGMAQINDTTAEHLLTAVVRDWRGKGVAKLIKQYQSQWAKKVGFKELVTYNEQWNEPIRELNKQLGYEPQPAHLIMRGPLQPDL